MLCLIIKNLIWHINGTFIPPAVVLVPAEYTVDDAGHELSAGHHGYAGGHQTPAYMGRGALRQVNGHRGRR